MFCMVGIVVFVVSVYVIFFILGNLIYEQKHLWATTITTYGKISICVAWSVILLDVSFTCVACCSYFLIFKHMFTWVSLISSYV